MKSLKQYSMTISEDAYHALPVWSHSMVARYAREGFSALKNLHSPVTETDSMRFGSLVDCILTKGITARDEYAISEGKIGDAEKVVFDFMLTHGPKQKLPFDKMSKEHVLEACAAVNYRSNYKDDTKYSKLKESANYYDILASGKKFISKDDWFDAVEIAKVFRTNPYLKELFGTKNTMDVEYLYQAKFQRVFHIAERDVKVKIMPDLLKINHAEKTIQPVDLKTSSQPAYEFKENFIKFRYDIQASMYTDTLQDLIDSDAEYRNYTILPYLFVDISRTDMVPVTYIYDPRSDSQRMGLSYTIGEREFHYKGWSELLEEILKYEESQAIVPSYIKTDEPNDLVTLLCK